MCYRWPEHLPLQRGVHMPIPIVIHTENGELHNATYSAESIAEAAKQEPSGVYTVSRTYHIDQVILLDAHFDRLEESAHLEDIPLHLDRAALRASVRKIVEAAGYQEARLRLTVARERLQEVIIAVEPLRLVTPAMRCEGVAVGTLFLPRSNPRAKRTEWVAIRNEARSKLAPEMYEGIRLTSDGYLTEGFSSNFYAILNGVLRTAEDDILHGIARRIVLSVAPEIVPVELHPIHKDEIQNIEEAFLTSSGRGVVPIVRINDIPIASGTPGPTTLKFTKEFDSWVEAHLEPI